MKTNFFALLFWLSLAGLSTSLSATTAPEASIQLFSRLSQSQATQTEPFTLEVEAWVTTERPLDVKQAFLAGKLRLQDPGLTLLHAAPSEAWTLEQMMPILRLRWRFSLRAQATGRFQSPSFSFDYAGERFKTEPHFIWIYNETSSLAEAKRAVLPILVYQTPNGTQPDRIGSAFLIRDNVLATSYHTLVKAERVAVRLPNGKILETNQAWRMDAKQDIALLEVSARDMRKASVKPLALATQDAKPALTEVVFTAGWPRGVQHPTAGILHRTASLCNGVNQWLSTNEVKPGDSGGPLLNANGEVLGVVSMGDMTSSGTGVTVSISINLAAFMAAQPKDLFEGRPTRFRQYARTEQAYQTPYRQMLEASDLLSLAADYKTSIQPEALNSSLQTVEAATEALPNDASLQFLKGSLYQLIGQEHKAAAAYQEALDKAETHFLAAQALGNFALRQYRFTEAIDYFKQVTTLAPYQLSAWLGLAQAHFMRGNTATAARVLRQFLSQDMNNPSALYWLALLYHREGNISRSLQLTAKLRSLNPDWGNLLLQDQQVKGFFIPFWRILSL